MPILAYEPRSTRRKLSNNREEAHHFGTSVDAAARLNVGLAGADPGIGRAGIDEEVVGRRRRTHTNARRVDHGSVRYRNVDIGEDCVDRVSGGKVGRLRARLEHLRASLVCLEDVRRAGRVEATRDGERHGCVADDDRLRQDCDSGHGEGKEGREASHCVC